MAERYSVRQLFWCFWASICAICCLVLALDGALSLAAIWVGNTALSVTMINLNGMWSRRTRAHAIEQV